MNDEGRSILRNVLKAAGPDGGLELTDIDILSIINNVMYIYLSKVTLLTLVLRHPTLHLLRSRFFCITSSQIESAGTDLQMTSARNINIQMRSLISLQ
jgi:hypothetical protein